MGSGFVCILSITDICLQKLSIKNISGLRLICNQEVQVAINVKRVTNQYWKILSFSVSLYLQLKVGSPDEKLLINCPT
ncbi:MAG: hypothetical protein EA396_06735 [Anaerolineaceae bacterium]|nr:MAG: hypothetical protein EA396_06735 [Anaerolineaceae bacterium]